MRLSPVDWVLAVLVVAALVTAVSIHPDAARPNFEFMPDMAHQPHYRAFEPNPNFRNGITWQAQPIGTIARGELPLGYAPTPDGAKRAGRDLINPVADDATTRDRGSVLYRAYCVPCHGGTGLGDGPITKRGYPPPPSLKLPNARNMRDGQLYHVITHGQGNMPPHGPQIDPVDRWKLVRYLRALQDEKP